MNYLILRSFRSFGQYLEKGTVVDESKIRNPRIRASERKITPAFSSSVLPEESGPEASTPQVSKKKKVTLTLK